MQIRIEAFMKRLLSAFPVILVVSNLFAQTATPEGSDAAAAGIFGVGIGCMILFYVIIAALWIVAAIWVMRDAKKRNSPNATLVTVLTWIPCTCVIGLIVHLITRPKTTPGAPPPSM